MYGDDAPIAAFATPLAESALAIIRTSGKNAVELLANIFSRPEKLLNAPGNSIVHGWIVENSNTAGSNTADSITARRIDEALVSVYRAPKSYTGEDGADISCHGGIAAARAVMGALKAAGFRDALPGEFTFRAFMNGKLDLTRSESVMELVAAKTNRGMEQAVRRLSGALEKEINEIKGLLTGVLAETEICLDYPEEELSYSDNSENLDNFENSEKNLPGKNNSDRLPGRAHAEEAVVRLKRLAASWRRERLYAEGALAVLAGRPNAGKSSLFNVLLREDRSIVTDIPGTTRDWIEALISVEDIPVRLVDTAGLRDSNNLKMDEAEQIGVKRSLDLLDRADIILYVIDGAEGIKDEDRIFLQREKPLLLLWNKADLAPPSKTEAGQAGGNLLAVSAKTGEGIPELVHSMAGLLEASSGGEASQDGPGTIRQKELIDAALASAEEALTLREPLDIIAPLLRSAIDSLGEITGEVSTADILEVMFSKFCVGK
jgi:tRNA modification GTPase